jgi:hypothetical protein
LNCAACSTGTFKGRTFGLHPTTTVELDTCGSDCARMQQAELDYLVNSPAAMTSLAENYVGLSFED